MNLCKHTYVHSLLDKRIDLKITQKHPKRTSIKTYEGMINSVRFELGALTDLQRDV